MISVLSVNHNGLDWIKLLVASVRKFSAEKHEILILDNASEDGSVKWLTYNQDVRAILSDKNMCHGPGLDYLLPFAQSEYALILDSDAHILRSGWEVDMLALYHSAENVRLVAAAGGAIKPIHPCVMFLKPSFFLVEKLSFVARDGYDVGRKNYFDLRERGYATALIPPGYEEGRTKYYPKTWGDTYYVDGKPTYFHHWYASRMWQQKQVDNLTRKEFEECKARLFSNLKVKEILGE